MYILLISYNFLGVINVFAYMYCVKCAYSRRNFICIPKTMLLVSRLK